MEIDVGTVLHGRWEIISKLCKGTYSMIYLAYSTVSDNEYAVKVDDQWHIADEKKFYDILHSRSSVTRPPKGILKVVDYGYKGDSSYLVFPRIGISLQKLWIMSHKTFSHATIAKIAIQAIQRLEYVHLKGVVHRAITSKNFIMGASHQDASTIYLIDYGKAKRYTTAPVWRTSRFEPGEYCHGGFCPRSDLKALAKMLIALHRGPNLKWLRGTQESKDEGRVRSYISWLGRGTRKMGFCRPKESWHYWQYLKYVDDLEDTHMPDYQFLIGLFTGFLEKIGERDHKRFQWMNVPGHRLIS